jgi:hypothetical protein
MDPMIILSVCCFCHTAHPWVICYLILFSSLFLFERATQSSNRIFPFLPTPPPIHSDVREKHFRTWLPGTCLLVCSTLAARDFFRLMKMSMGQSHSIMKEEKKNLSWVKWFNGHTALNGSHATLPISFSKFAFHQAHSFIKRIRLNGIHSHSFNKSNWCPSYCSGKSLCMNYSSHSRTCHINEYTTFLIETNLNKSHILTNTYLWATFYIFWAFLFISE